MDPNTLKYLNKALVFIGRKFDDLEVLLRGNKSEIKVDLGDSSEILLAVSGKLDDLISKMADGMEMEKKSHTNENNKLIDFSKSNETLNRAATLLKDLVIQTQSKNEKGSEIYDAVSEVSNKFKSLVDIINKQSDSIAAFVEQVKNSNQSKTVTDALVKVTNTLEKFEVKIPEIKFPTFDIIEGKLGKIIDSVNSIKLKEVSDLLNEINSSIKNKKLEFPKSLLLDNAQFRELRTLLAQGSGKGSVVVAGGTGEIVSSTIRSGKKTVTTAGTRVVLGTTVAKSVTIRALATNTGLIYVGDVTVASTNGFQLSAGESVSLDISTLSRIYIDSSVNGEGVTYVSMN